MQSGSFILVKLCSGMGIMAGQPHWAIQQIVDVCTLSQLVLTTSCFSASGLPGRRSPADQAPRVQVPGKSPSLARIPAAACVVGRVVDHLQVLFRLVVLHTTLAIVLLTVDNRQHGAMLRRGHAAQQPAVFCCELYSYIKDAGDQGWPCYSWRVSLATCLARKF
jgi:hypothetical protein